MTHELTLERNFHIARGRRRGKGLRAGAAPPEQDRRIPRIARLMALAIRFDHLIASGQVVNQAQLARLGRVSRARVTQIMNLVLLAPKSRKSYCSSPADHPSGRPYISASCNRLRRRPIGTISGSSGSLSDAIGRSRVLVDPDCRGADPSRTRDRRPTCRYPHFGKKGSGMSTI